MVKRVKLRRRATFGQIGQTAAWRFFDVSKMAALCHTGFVMCVFEPPRRAFCGLYCSAKFGWNRCSSFDNTNVFRFREFGLKSPIHAPKIGGFGSILPPKWGTISTKPKKAHPCVSPRRLSHHARKSVDASDLYVSSQKRA